MEEENKGPGKENEIEKGTCRDGESSYGKDPPHDGGPGGEPDSDAEKGKKPEMREKTLLISVIAALVLVIAVVAISLSGAGKAGKEPGESTAPIEGTVQSESTSPSQNETDSGTDSAGSLDTEPEVTTAKSDALAFVPNGDGTCYVAGIGTYRLTEVEIPTLSPTGDIVTGIGSYAFYNCSSLVSISIPSTVRTIGEYAFLGCNSLLTIVVSQSNTAFRSVEGVLYSRDGTRLICYPALRGTTSCVIPVEVTVIENGAFSGVKTLKNVYFPGSAARWTEIRIGTNNEILDSVILTCNYPGG